MALVQGPESDEILDLTPTDAPDRGRGSVDSVDMMPANAPDGELDEPVDATRAYPPRSGFDEPVDEFVDEPVEVRPAHVPEGGEADETVVATPSPMSGRGPKAECAAPPPRAPGRPRKDQDNKRTKPAGRRWKRVVPALLAIAVLLFAGNSALGHGLGIRIGAPQPAAGNPTTSQPASTAPANAPTPRATPSETPAISTVAGPLILLNPGVVRQGTGVNVTGSGFDAGAFVDLTIRRQGSNTSLASKAVQADKGGTFSGAGLTVPSSLTAGNFVVVASERNSKLTAQAMGTVSGGTATVKLATQVGKPGDVVGLALHGFAPGETVNVHWNTLTGQPVATFQADGGGGVGQASLRVPVGAVGDNTFLFEGAKSQSVVAANFLMLQLYPTVKLGSYALKADNVMTYSGSGFGPGERVFVFLNNTNGAPLAVVNTDAAGGFKNAPGFVVPFAATGKQTLIFMGEQSRTPAPVSFTVLPYAPTVQASTYGGLPGMTITFYAAGFARDEVVHVYAGHTKSSMGTMVSCFRADDKGNAASAGSYVIPGNAQGTLGFALVGAKSGGIGQASVSVGTPPAPVQIAPQQPFTCPLDQQTPQSQQTPTP